VNDAESGAAAAPRLLVPLDDSPEARSALPYALALATPGTEITLLTVVPEPDSVAGLGNDVLIPAEEEIRQDEAAAKATLETVAKPLREAGHTVTTDIATGDPAKRIVETAANLGASLIVMASHGRGVLGRLLHGSVADSVAREATVPVMVVRAEQAQPGAAGISRLVVPLDGSPLAETALPVAEGISQRLATSIYLVRVVNPAVLIPPAAGIGEVIPASIYDETEEQLERDAEEYLAAVAKRLRAAGRPVASKVLIGAPAAAIMEATQPGDVVVLCSHERSGVLRWLMGSVAEQLVRDDECPVILVPAPEEGPAGQ
jgi:nucleotide-binding universal stress UspA family protein